MTDVRPVWRRVFFPPRRLTWAGLVIAIESDRQRLVETYKQAQSAVARMRTQEHIEKGKKPSREELGILKLEARIDALGDLLSSMAAGRAGVIEVVTMWRTLVPSRSRRPIVFVPEGPAAFRDEHDRAATIWVV